MELGRLAWAVHMVITDLAENFSLLHGNETPNYVQASAAKAL